MHPVFMVEFKARQGEVEFADECVTLSGAEELFEFVGPGGGCDAIPDAVDEIHFTLQPDPDNRVDPRLGHLPTSLQLGMVFITGPLGQIVPVVEQLGERAERGLLSGSFLKVIGAGP